jgi:hypothetical protein
MNFGMLWFDNDPKSGLDAKIERAAHYYRDKYGKVPNVCFVHPKVLEAVSPGSNDQGESRLTTREGIEVRPNRSILPNHFWLGVNGSA